MQSIIFIVRLYFIHIFAFITVGLSMYYPPCDILLAFIYLILIGIEAYNLGPFSFKTKIITILTWQAPGFLLLFFILGGASIGDISNYSFFIMLFWYTPLIPLLSLLPDLFLHGWPLYYYVLLTLPLIMIVYHFRFSFFKAK
jgi:hypothetical protein